VRLTETSAHVCFLLETITQVGVAVLGQAAEELGARLDADRVEALGLPQVSAPLRSISFAILTIGSPGSGFLRRQPGPCST
jgi:hypothetical protein